MSGNPSLQTITIPDAMRAWSLCQRNVGRRIGFVPTMGALHKGHLSLIRRAKTQTDTVVVSIYVNPTQFGPGEDLDRYPRNPHADLTLCRSEGVECVFMPDSKTIYAPDHSVFVDEHTLSSGLCGRTRHGHFRGVLTIVAKLFHIVQPDLAVFGQKDAQQAALIRRMIRDLHFGIELDIAPTCRDPDGLAMSSRNRYLTAEQRRQALALPAALQLIAQYATQTKTPKADEACRLARLRLNREPDLRVEYLDCVDQASLETVPILKPGVLVAVAARIGTTRLIDNILVPEETTP